MYRQKLANILMDDNDNCKTSAAKDLQYLTIHLLNKEVDSFFKISEIEARRILEEEYSEELEELEEKEESIKLVNNSPFSHFEDMLSGNSDSMGTYFLHSQDFDLEDY